MNFLVVCGGAIGVSLSVCVANGLGGASKDISRNVKAQATREISREELRERKQLQVAQEKELGLALSKKEITILTVTQKSSLSRGSQLAINAQASFKPGDRATVSGERCQYAATGLYLVDGNGQVALVGEDGILQNPSDDAANYLPQLTSRSISIAKKNELLRRSNIFVTEAAKLDCAAENQPENQAIELPTEVSKQP